MLYDSLQRIHNALLVLLYDWNSSSFKLGCQKVIPFLSYFGSTFNKLVPVLTLVCDIYVSNQFLSIYLENTWFDPPMNNMCADTDLKVNKSVLKIHH
jgi:hypothetical protein